MKTSCLKLKLECAKRNSVFEGKHYTDYYNYNSSKSTNRMSNYEAARSLHEAKNMLSATLKQQKNLDLDKRRGTDI